MSLSARLLTVFRYERASGRLAMKRNGREITGPQCIIRTHRYQTASFDGRIRLASHIIWAIETDRWPDPGLVIDHIDGNILNNHISNLQEISRAENSGAKRRAEAIQIALTQLGVTL